VNGVGYAPGKFGQAFSFDGTNDSVRVPDSSSLDLASTWTLSAWIYTTDLTGHVGGAQGIISKVGGPAGNYGYQFGIMDSSGATGATGALFIQFNTASGAWPTDSLTAGAISKNVWTFVATTFDGTWLKLYVDGSPVGSDDVSDAPKSVANSASYFRIALDDNGNVPFEGYIDRVSVYDHTLSAGEISALYQEGVVPVPGAVLLGAVGLGLAGWRLRRIQV